MALDFEQNKTGRIYLHILPILIWFVAIAGVVALFKHRAERFEVVGIAQSHTTQIASIQTGRLRSVNVELFDTVSKNQTVAVLDDTLLKAEITTARAEIKKLTAELKVEEDKFEVEQINLQNHIVATYRRYTLDVENYRLRKLELIAAIEPDKINLENLKLASKMFVMGGNLELSDLAPLELKQMELQIEELSKKIKENQVVLAQAQNDLDMAQQRFEEFTNNKPELPPIDNSLEIITQQINVQEKMIDQLSIQLASLVLKSPFDGMVSQLNSRDGETVLPGEPLMTIAETHPSKIIAYVTEDSTEAVEENMKVELMITGQQQQIADSQVVQVGPAMEMMPERLWRNPNIPQWGRPFLITVPPAMTLTPGQMVGIRKL
ncbi:MAG: HlyD family efflux transporter periplasmic adaptor subunit [Sedimentisphaerales bacterium]|nr:HlyD family efflux transporter periplasmic adaptor subunit [Sedimentisphaerales bacterium]